MNTYPTSYKPKSIEEQRAIFDRLFTPQQTVSKAPESFAEASFLIPRWQRFGTTYNEAVIEMLRILGTTRPFVNWLDGKLGPDHFRETEAKKKALAQFTGDYYEIPAQFGMRWKGKSVDTARASLAPGEFLLGAFEVACMLLTHPERLQSYSDLWIGCGGDDYSYSADGSFPDAPIFFWDDGKVKFGSKNRDNADEYYGSASGLVPQIS